MHKRTMFASLVALAAMLMPTLASAQVADDDTDEAPPPPKKKAKKAPVVEESDDDDDDAPAAKPAAAPGKAAEPAAAEPPSEPADDAKPTLSFAVERVAGFGYASASATDGGTSASLTVLNLGGINLNPYAVSRAALDFRVAEQIWIGGSLGFSTFSASASDGEKSQDIGSLTLYTLTPRASYQMDIQPNLVFLPRLGFVLAGGSAKAGEGDSKFGIFSFGLSAEAVMAYRFTKTFNFLAGLSVERTLAASVSSSGGESSSESSDIKGSFTSVQLWLGLGGWK